MRYYPSQPKSGFALLMTLLVVSVIISVGLTILDVTIKQVRLSSNAKDSEIAFHAASAGLECAQFWRRQQTTNMETGVNDLALTCFGASATKINSTLTDIDPRVTPIPIAGAGAVAYAYSYQFTWSTGSETKCSQIDTLIMMSAAALSSITATDMVGFMPGYPSLTGKTCPAGGVCTTLAVRGFNRACPTGGGSFPAGTIQREVLLEY